MRKILKIITIAAILGLTTMRTAHAQEATTSAQAVHSLNLTLSPVTLQLETDPGNPVTSQIKIRNNSDFPEHLKITIGKFTADASGAKPRLMDPEPGDEYLTWIRLPEPVFDVGPGEWKTVDFSFNPPESAALSYFYTLQVSRNVVIRPGGSETAITGVPSILLLANVHSPFAKRELSLEQFNVSQSVFEYLPEEFVVKIKNSGNIYAMPSGNIFIDGQGKKDLAVLSLNPAQSSILPQTSREFRVKWDEGFPRFVTETDENGKEKRRLEWDFSKAHLFRIGKFTAHLILVYDNGERDVPVESFVTFWVIPWKIIGITILIALFVLLGIRSVLRSVIAFIRPKLPSNPPQSEVQ